MDYGDRFIVSVITAAVAGMVYCIYMIVTYGN